MEVNYRILLCFMTLCHYSSSQSGECNRPLGMQNKGIPNERIKSSSRLDSDHQAFYGRLHGPKAWCSADGDENPYIEIELGEEKAITAISTQGGSTSVIIWSRKFKIEYDKGGKWTHYKEDCEENYWMVQLECKGSGVKEKMIVTCLTPLKDLFHNGG